MILFLYLPLYELIYPNVQLIQQMFTKSLTGLCLGLIISTMVLPSISVSVVISPRTCLYVYVSHFNSELSDYFSHGNIMCHVRVLCLPSSNILTDYLLAIFFTLEIYEAGLPNK